MKLNTIAAFVELHDQGKEDEVERLERMKKRNAHQGLFLKQTKLIQYAKSNQFKILKQLGFVYYENDTNIRDEDGKTPLYYTCLQKNIDFCKFLINKEAHVDLVADTHTGNYPLHLAFNTNDIKDCQLITYLCKLKGADLNILNKKNETPLAFASKKIL